MTHHLPIARHRWLVLLPILTGIAIVSLGIHDIAIEHLGIPYPTLVHPPAWVGVAGDTGRILALIVFALLARRFFDGLSIPIACLIVGAFEAFLSERFRVNIIELFLAEGWRDTSWLYVLMDLLSPVVTSLAQGAAASLIARLLVPRGVIVAIVAAVIAGAAIRLGVAPLATQAATWLQSVSGVTETTQYHFPPYTGVSLAVIYLTFIEPTLASFVMARLVLPVLPGSRAMRIALFCVLVLGCAGRVTSLLLTTFWVHQPPLLAIASTGQFTAETLVMAALTGWLASAVMMGDRTPPWAGKPA